VTVFEFHFLIAIGGVLMIVESTGVLTARWFKLSEIWTKFGLGIGLVILALIPIWSSLPIK
jgi:hypothetical protein